MSDNSRSGIQRREFPYAGITVFILFFGTSMLDAIRGAHWPRILFWLAIGTLFLALDRMRLRRPAGDAK